ATGIEYWLIPYLALRTGYVQSHTEGNGMRAGIGVRMKNITFDYAYAGYGDLGIVHRYELSLSFGTPRPLLTADERNILRRAKIAMKQGEYSKAVLLFNSLIELVPQYRPAHRYIQ